MCVHKEKYITSILYQKPGHVQPLSIIWRYRNSRHPTGALIVLKLDKHKENMSSTEDSTVEIFKKRGEKKPQGDTKPRSHKPRISHPTLLTDEASLETT